jgi:hypothetical protein
MANAAKKTNEGAKSSTGIKRRRAPAAAAAATAVTRKRAETAPISKPQPTKPAFKRDQLAALLVRDQGATIAQMREATGWLPHTVRAALTGLRKLGYAIDSDKIDGLRTYRAGAPE